MRPSGARGIDAEACAALIRAAKGARMLGARVILTGIQPRIAQTLIEQGIDLQGNHRPRHPAGRHQARDPVLIEP
jgi:anti-anti-sigma regulatory factor